MLTIERLPYPHPALRGPEAQRLFDELLLMPADRRFDTLLLYVVNQHFEIERLKALVATAEQDIAILRRQPYGTQS